MARVNPETFVKTTLQSVVGERNVHPAYFPAPAIPETPYAIYAATGEEVEIGLGGMLIRSREFRVEIHHAEYDRVVAADRQAIHAFMSSGRLASSDGVFDDWSLGPQPRYDAQRARVPLENTPEGVYRRIRTLSIEL